MKQSRSFSLMTLILFTSVCALAVLVYATRTDVVKLTELNGKLKEQSGFIDIEDSSKLHVRRLRYDIPMTFRFQLSIPDGQSYTLKIGEGALDDESEYPQAIITGKIVGSEGQGPVVINLRRIGSGWTLREYGDMCEISGAFCDNPDRFQWLEQSLDTAFSIEWHRHGNAEMFENGTPVILLRRSENDGVRFGTVDIESPRVFMIWLEPSESLSP